MKPSQYFLSPSGFLLIATTYNCYSTFLKRSCRSHQANHLLLTREFQNHVRGTRGRNIIQRLTPSFPTKDTSWATSLIPFLFVMPGGTEKKHPELPFPRARFWETAVSKIRIKLHCNRARQSLQDMNGTIIISSSVKGSIDSHINEKAGNSKKIQDELTTA